MPFSFLPFQVDQSFITVSLYKIYLHSLVLSAVLLNNIFRILCDTYNKYDIFYITHFLMPTISHSIVNVFQEYVFNIKLSIPLLINPWYSLSVPILLHNFTTPRLCHLFHPVSPPSVRSPYFVIYVSSGVPLLIVV